jgi:competence protein ComGC
MAYVNFVENNKEKMSLDHEYTNEALSKLITDAMANEVGYDVQADIEKQGICKND